MKRCIRPRWKRAVARYFDVESVASLGLNGPERRFLYNCALKERAASRTSAAFSLENEVKARLIRGRFMIGHRQQPCVQSAASSRKCRRRCPGSGAGSFCDPVSARQQCGPWRARDDEDGRAVWGRAQRAAGHEREPGPDRSNARPGGGKPPSRCFRCGGRFRQDHLGSGRRANAGLPALGRQTPAGAAADRDRRRGSLQSHE